MERRKSMNTLSDVAKKKLKALTLGGLAVAGVLVLGGWGYSASADAASSSTSSSTSTSTSSSTSTDGGGRSAASYDIGR